MQNYNNLNVDVIERPYFKDVNVVEVLQFENVYDTIISQADKNDIDLIVMVAKNLNYFQQKQIICTNFLFALE